MATLARYWREWINRYTNNSAYWYVPKGKSVGDTSTIQKQLKILEQYEGQLWRDSQKVFLNSLSKAKLSSATAKDEDNKGIPMSRMLAQVFSMLGFAWIDESEAITLTPAGEAFISAKDPVAIVATQAKRYQIANPMAGGKATQEIEIRPVPYLLEVLLETKTLTRTEYILFCAKSRSFGDIEDTVEEITEWRKLGPRQQAVVINVVDAVPISTNGKKSRRTSMYNTVKLNSTYAFAFWTASQVIRQASIDGESVLSIPREKLPEANAIVKKSQREGQYIAFATKKDWMAFYGDPTKPPNKSLQLDIFHARKLPNFFPRPSLRGRGRALLRQGRQGTRELLAGCWCRYRSESGAFYGLDWL